MPSANNLKIKLFADGADLESMVGLYNNPLIKGFTTNPTLMRKVGIANYEFFAHDVLQAIPDRPVSFEVFADDLPTMELQARKISSWGTNVNVKIPVTNTRGEFCGPIIERLSKDGICLNITAVFSLAQVQAVAHVLSEGVPSIISVFAGRIADTGVDPVPLMRDSLDIMAARPRAELLWASPRELLNIFQADKAGCHIITATPGLLKKLENIGKDLEIFSLETVRMFYEDAAAAGYDIGLSGKAAAD